MVLSEIVDYFILKMRGCPKASSRLKIVEYFLEDERISPFILEYYPCGEDAKAQFEFLKIYRLELDAMKGVQSPHMLARKSVLFDAAISTSVNSTIALSRVLKVHLANLKTAITCCMSLRSLPKPFELAK